MRKVIIIHILMVVAIVFMVHYLFFDRGPQVTKEERLHNLSVRGIDYKDYNLNVSNEIVLALEDNKNWARLFLSDNFKKKFKNRKGIIPEINNYCWIGGGNSYDYPGRKVIVISADKKKGLFDFDDWEGVTTEFYFEYFMDENNEIDDIKLIEKMDTNSCTGEVISNS